ncbi:hypothetical protein ARSEF4850_002932 [Beauveria asiatica]
MSSSIFLSCKGLPGADSEEIERVLKAKICFRRGGSEEICFDAPISLLFSQPIHALVQSADAQICVNFEVSDLDIFYRFFQFVYTAGNYDGYTASEGVSLANDTTNKLPFRTEISAKMVDSRETRPVFRFVCSEWECFWSFRFVCSEWECFWSFRFVCSEWECFWSFRFVCPEWECFWSFRFVCPEWECFWSFRFVCYEGKCSLWTSYFVCSERFWSFWFVCSEWKSFSNFCFVCPDGKCSLWASYFVCSEWKSF